MTTTARERPHYPLAVRLLLACGASGPLLFIFVFLVEGATRPGYNPVRHFVSSLSLGQQGWMQIANFVVCGALVTGFAAGLRRVLRPGRGSTWGPILLGVFGVSLVGAGIFVTDPLLDYPPGAAATPTLHGSLHLLLSLIVFSALPAACFVLARRFARDPAWRGWTLYSVLTGVLVIVLFIATDVVASLPDPAAPAGLVQRLTIYAGWFWISLLGFRLLAQKAPASA